MCTTQTHLHHSGVEKMKGHYENIQRTPEIHQQLARIRTGYYKGHYICICSIYFVHLLYLFYSLLRTHWGRQQQITSRQFNNARYFVYCIHMDFRSNSIYWCKNDYLFWILYTHIHSAFVQIHKNNLHK